MISAILFYEDKDNVKGIRIHSFGDTVEETINDRFQGDYDAVVEFIQSGISGGGYLTAEDVSTYHNPGDSYSGIDKKFETELDIANSGVNHFYRLEQNGLVREVEPKITTRFIVRTQK